MKLFYVAEEAPAGNFTTLAECETQDECFAFVKGQPGRVLHVCTATERTKVVSHDGESVSAAA